MKPCLSYSLIFALCCFSAFAQAEALLNQSNGSCFELNTTYLTDSSCETTDNHRSARSKIRGFFYGQIIKRIWKNSKEQVVQNQLDDGSIEKVAAAQQDEKVHHQSVLQKMLDDADFDLDASSHRLIFSVKMRF